jgi:hypothetical protein
MEWRGLPFSVPFIMSCKDDMLPILAGSGDGDVSEGLGKAGGRSLGRGGAALFAPLYAGNCGRIGVGFDISKRLRSPCFGGKGAILLCCCCN